MLVQTNYESLLKFYSLLAYDFVLFPIITMPLVYT